MTSSGRASSDCGTVGPSASAAFRLVTSSNVVDCSIRPVGGFGNPRPASLGYEGPDPITAAAVRRPRDRRSEKGRLPGFDRRPANGRCRRIVVTAAPVGDRPVCAPMPTSPGSGRVSTWRAHKCPRHPSCRILKGIISTAWDSGPRARRLAKPPPSRRSRSKGADHEHNSTSRQPDRQELQRGTRAGSGLAESLRGIPKAGDF